MIFVFDLDDTLYPEITFVESGFRAVAAFLEKMHNIPRDESMRMMLYELQQNGRGKIFDVLLKHFNFSSKKLRMQCLKVYRSHKPEITLFEDAEIVLTHLKDYTKYIITDGNKNVQHNKVEALQLYPRFKKVFITRRYGLDREKPNPFCFLKICQMEKVGPQDVVYIGDNPNKDFIKIKQLGFKTIRVRRGMFENHSLSEEYEASQEVNKLTEIDFNSL
jgi:putative hydrolase of the HAD superfamily